MNSLLSSKEAAHKPGHLIHMPTLFQEKTGPVTILIITTSWKEPYPFLEELLASVSDF